MNLALNQPFINSRTTKSKSSHSIANPPSQLNTECLPHSVQVLIQLLGTQTTMRVLLHCGGRSVYIPKRIKQSCTLLEVLSPQELAKMVDYYGGETIDLPQAGSLERHWRNLDIAAASAAGASRADLVAKYGLSQRQIGNIRRRYRSLIDYLSSPHIMTANNGAH